MSKIKVENSEQIACFQKEQAFVLLKMVQKQTTVSGNQPK